MLDIFYTQRWAAIKNPWLAYPYWTGLILILLNTVYSLIWRQGYLYIDDQMRGVIRPRLTLPEVPEVAMPRKVPEYCITGRCHRWDPLEVSKDIGSGFFVATRVQVTKELSHCREKPGEATVGASILHFLAMDEGEGGNYCRHDYEQSWTRDFFIADVESYILETRANVESAQLSAMYTGTPEQAEWNHDNMNLVGALAGGPGLEPFIEPSEMGTPDSFTLSQWLQAAGVESLDNRSDSSHSTATDGSFRHEGAVLEVTYEYTNMASEGLFQKAWLFWAMLTGRRPPFTYRVVVSRVPGSEFLVQYLPLNPCSMLAACTQLCMLCTLASTCLTEFY